MITIAFEKKDNGIYVAHTDILRSLNRTFRRAGILVNYSKGYNRHMNLKLTQPLPFGIASKEEWVTADIDENYQAEEILRLFNENCPPYLYAYKAYKIDANPNLGGKVVASDYRLKSDKAITFAQDILSKLKTLEITKTRGEQKTLRANELIYKADIDTEGIYLLQAFGNINLRIDLVAQELNKLFDLDLTNTDLVRLNQYVMYEEKLVTADEYIKSLI